MNWGDSRVASSVWQYVIPEPNSGCWLWTRGGANGYGQLFDGAKTIYVHRWMYTVLSAAIPAGLQIDHKCRNRRCCNPRHLEPVTRKANILRGTAPSAANARKTVCRRGHALQGEGAEVYMDGTERVCKLCRRLNHHLRKAKRDELTR